MERKIKGVIFDLDGVIVDTASLHYLGWKRLADELGIPFDEIKNEEMKGVSRMDSLRILLGQNHTYSLEEMKELAERKNTYYVESLQQISPHDLFDGTKEVIDYLRKAGAKVGLASASKNAKTVLGRLQVTELFDVIVDGYDFKETKPAPEVFLVTARRLNVKPEVCMVVEDAKVGVTAAKAAGMLAVGLGNPGILDNADFVISNLGELLSILTLNNLL